jgi:hypothetical protein
MLAPLGKKLAIAAFLAALALPLAAAMASGKFVETVRTAWRQPDAWSHTKEVLRRSTPLWTRAVEGYTRLMYSLGSSPNRNVAVIGRDGFVFLGDDFNRNFSQAIGRRVYSDQEVAEWAQTLALQREWLKTQGSDMMYVVAPAKWSVYPDKLPAWVDGRKAPRTLERLLADPAVHPTLLDVRPNLIRARDGADTYSPLNTHWTDYGALIAWQAIAEALAKRDPKYAGLYVPPYSGVTLSDSDNEFEGLIGLKGNNPWTMPIYRSALPAYQVVDDNGAVLGTYGGARKTDLLDLPRSTRGLGAPLPMRVLVMRDSMGNSLSPFLQAAFGETVQVDHKLGTGNPTDLVPLVRRYHPDLVIYVVTERYLERPNAQVQRWRTLARSASGG